MTVLLENTTNYVFQAFQALQQDKKGYVHKSKLKVLRELIWGWLLRGFVGGMQQVVVFFDGFVCASRCAVCQG